MYSDNISMVKTEQSHHLRDFLHVALQPTLSLPQLRDPGTLARQRTLKEDSRTEHGLEEIASIIIAISSLSPAPLQLLMWVSNCVVATVLLAASPPESTDLLIPNCRHLDAKYCLSSPQPWHHSSQHIHP